MTDSRHPGTPRNAYRANEAPDRPRRRRAKAPEPTGRPAALGRASTSAHGSVPTWDQARRALFGGGRSVGLLHRCTDDEWLIAAAHDRHPYLAAYCAHIGRNELAHAPIHDEEQDRGRRELERLREAYEALAAPWEERRRHGLALDLRGRGTLRKPDFAGVLMNRGDELTGAHADKGDRGPRGRTGVASAHRRSLPVEHRGGRRGFVLELRERSHARGAIAVACDRLPVERRQLRRDLPSILRALGAEVE